MRHVYIYIYTSHNTHILSAHIYMSQSSFSVNNLGPTDAHGPSFRSQWQAPQLQIQIRQGWGDVHVRVMRSVACVERDPFSACDGTILDAQHVVLEADDAATRINDDDADRKMDYTIIPWKMERFDTFNRQELGLTQKIWSMDRIDQGTICRKLFQY